VFALEVDKSVIDADPELTRYIKVVSHSVEIIEEFTIFLLDCVTDQTITLDGEALSPIVRELAKNDGLQSLLSAEETAAFFTVSDTRPECAITSYILYKTAADELTDADTDLYARLDGANYAADGAVNIVTDIDAASAEEDVVFYILATTELGVEAVTPSITVTLSCIDVTTITTTYTSGNGVSIVLDYTDDGYFYKIFIEELGVTESVDLSAVATYVTDRPDDCDCLGIDLVTDDTGTTPYSASVFSETDLTLMIDTSTAFYGDVFLKALTYVDEVFQVDKVLVTICGDQEITNTDPTNAVFTIDASKTQTPAWTSFSLDGIWTTESATLPLNECPVTDIQVCEDDACATVLTEESGLRITNTDGVFALEVDKSVIDADPQLTRYIKVVSHSVELIEEFTIFLLDCTTQTITLDGEATSEITRELAKNDGLQSLLTVEETEAFFVVSDERPECAITSYVLYKSDTEELTSADTDLFARLDGTNYADDGAVTIDTDIDAASAEQDVVFYILAITDEEISAVTPSITVTLSCIDVSSITTTYTSGNGVSIVLDYTDDGYFYKIFIEELGSTSTVDLTAVATYVTDRPDDCDCLGINLVTDASGTTLYSDSVFTEADYTLTIDTSAAFYGDVFLKAITYVDEVFQVDKVLVTICGD